MLSSPNRSILSSRVDHLGVKENEKCRFSGRDVVLDTVVVEVIVEDCLLCCDVHS